MDLDKVCNALKKSWSKETCYTPMQSMWSLKNPSQDQCYCTTLVLHDFFGGKILKAKCSNGVNHYWNIINGAEIDITKAQFKSGEKIKAATEVPREELEENKRYIVLKQEVLKKL